MRFTSFDLLHSYKFTNEIANCLLNYYMLDESSSEKTIHVPLRTHCAAARVSSSMNSNHAEITVSLNLGHPASTTSTLRRSAMIITFCLFPYLKRISMSARFGFHKRRDLRRIKHDQFCLFLHARAR